MVLPKMIPDGVMSYALFKTPDWGLVTMPQSTLSRRAAARPRAKTTATLGRDPYAWSTLCRQGSAPLSPPRTGGPSPGDALVVPTDSHSVNGQKEGMGVDRPTTKVPTNIASLNGATVEGRKLNYARPDWSLFKRATAQATGQSSQTRSGQFNKSNTKTAVHGAIGKLSIFPESANVEGSLHRAAAARSAPKKADLPRTLGTMGITRLELALKDHAGGSLIHLELDKSKTKYFDPFMATFVISYFLIPLRP